MSNMKTEVINAVVSLGCRQATARMVAGKATDTVSETAFMAHAKTWLAKSGKVSDAYTAANTIWSAVKSFQFAVADTTEPTDAQIWAAEFAQGIKDAKSE